MTAKLIDGKAIAASVRAQVKEKVSLQALSGGIPAKGGHSWY